MFDVDYRRVSQQTSITGTRSWNSTTRCFWKLF